MARTIAAVTDDLDGMRFNTAISRLMEFVNFFTGQDVRPEAAMETFTLLLAPMAPHLAEELWELLGHPTTLAYEPWPSFDPTCSATTRSRSRCRSTASSRPRSSSAPTPGPRRSRPPPGPTRGSSPCSQGKAIRKTVVVPGKLVNFVI